MNAKKHYVPFWIKLSLIYSVIVLSIFSITLPLVFPQIIDHSKQEVQRQLDNQAVHVIDTLDYQLETMRNIYIRLKSDSLLQMALQAQDHQEQLQAQKYIIRVISTLSNIWNSAIYIQLYDCRSDYFYSSRSYSTAALVDRSWMDDLDDLHGMYNFHVVLDKNNYDTRCLVIGDTIHQSLIYEKLAYFSVNIVLSSLGNQILPPDFTEGTLQILTDESGNYVLGDRISAEVPFYLLKGGSLKLNGQKYIISQASSAAYGFTYYILTPEKDAYSSLHMLLNAILAIVFGVLVVAISISFLLARQITTPINQLTDMVTNYSGDIDSQNVIWDLKLNNEFSLLNKRLVQMSAKISTLIHDVYEQQIVKQQLELRTLYKSINPHFIYNILDAIQWELRLGQTNAALNTLYTFSHYLRNTLVLNQEQKTVAALRASIQGYCDLQNTVSDEVDCHVQFPSELDSCLVPSMIVLPLVENCFVHAFPDTFSGEKQISVSAETEADFLVIHVEDTGCGISPDDLAVIRQLLAAPLEYELDNNSTRFFALKNIQSRIRLSCGEGYGLKITNLARGTRFSLYLPLQGKEM